jgi:hypothetical protein
MHFHAADRCSAAVTDWIKEPIFSISIILSGRIKV